MSDIALELERISQRFGSVLAVDDASIAIRRGRVHALLGENGAGKTTLMRIAFGMLQPDRGTMRIDGLPVSLPSPTSALARGIGMVHQHFTLVPAMTVAENVALGGRGLFDPRQAAAQVRAVAERAGLSIDPDAQVSTLQVGAQQRCEIIKALARDVQLLILDEPTAVLAPSEAQELLRWVRAFADSGRAVVLITHKLRDALSVADDFTVLRHGRVAWSGPAAEASERQLASAMLGETVPAGDGTPGREEVLRVLEGERVLPPSPLPAAASPVVARADALWVRDGRGVMRVRDVTIACHAGEIVGIAGIEGAGQHELLRALAGRIVPTRGTLTLPARVGFIPEDRHRDGLMLDEELVSNIALRDAHARRGAMPWQALRAETGTIIEQYDVRGAGPATVARALSGGNQQKLVLGRELHGRPPLLVAENPTRGLDFHATLAIQRALRTARGEGTAIVFYSSDLDEVIALSDRVFAMREGELAQCSRDRNAVGRAMLSAS